MKRTTVFLSLLLVTMLLGAGAIFAQEDSETAAEETATAVQEEAQAADTHGEEVAEPEAATNNKPMDILYISAAFGMALVSSVCAVAMGIAIKSFSEGVSRNPGAGDKLQFGLLLTLVLIETLALYVLAVLFVKVV